MAVDLAAARLRLMERKQELEQRSAHAKSDMRHESDPLVADFADQATQREDDEVLAQISDSADTELLQIRRALARLNSGDYEICARCGGTIAPGRLQAVPATDRCSGCAG
ncbi:MAG: TraR/DksA C4-type zinc finger protein [Steroidobacteraceae bacterium]|jgi:RNA polymerase-binding protein DksA